jgi:hypothetical protein
MTIACSICVSHDRVVHHPAATENDDGCPYRKKSDPASRVVEVRRTFKEGFPFYGVYDGANHLELFDYFENAMRFAKRFAKVLNKGAVRYVRNGAATS